MEIQFRILTAVILVVAASGCGGGGGSSRSVAAAPPPSATSDFDRGVFRDESVFKDLCATPRAGNFPDAQGSAEDENYWLRSWSNDLYLWYDEIDDKDPALFTTPDYFDQMKTFATTPSGAQKDQFHFTFDTQEWEQLSQSGISAGYGVEFALLASAPPRDIVIAYVETGGPGAGQFRRGQRIQSIDGVDAINAGTAGAVATLNAGLFPEGAGESHQFVVLEPDGVTQTTINVVSAEVTSDPVPVVTTFPIQNGSALAGYILFNSHIATAETGLVSAINQLATAGVTELLLDLRYNGGGFLDIANELAYMIAGPAAAQGRVFGELEFNDKHPTINPVTGASLAPDFFHTETQGFSLTSGQNLPSLNLARVFILGGPGTCSASEAIINGLRGIDVEVVLIGNDTCGKPYGFYAQDNCGTTYFSIQFRGINAKGFGDYADGFTTALTPVREDQLPGCVVEDDFGSALGDIVEGRTAAALEYIDFGTCPAGTNPAAVTAATVTKSLQSRNDPASVRSPRAMPGWVMRSAQ